MRPAPIPVPREIELSTDALRQKFSELLARESLSTIDLASAIATFVYKGDCTWPEACLVQVETYSGLVLEDAVGHDGHRAEVLRDNKLLHAMREARAREQ